MNGVNPWLFDAHPAAWVAIVAIGVTWFALTHFRWADRRYGTTSTSARATSETPPANWRVRPSHKQWLQISAGLVALGAVITWPIGDLAERWSLTALVLQRLVIVLCTAPLLLLATPSHVLAAITRPAVIDRILEAATRPVAAAVAVTIIGVGTVVPAVVAAQAEHLWVRALTTGLVLGAGLLLWAPVLPHIPGASRPTPVGRAAYLFVQSVLPTFPAVIYVLASHPFYPVYAGVHQALGISPLADQQVAGIVVKVGILPVLWTMAWVALSRAGRFEEEGDSGEALLWVDVERRLARLDRKNRAEHRRRSRRSWAPRPLDRDLPIADPGSDD